MPGDKTTAAAALSQALVLSPADYWLAGRLAIDAARLWSHLDPDTRNMAIRQATALWGRASAA